MLRTMPRWQWSGCIRRSRRHNTMHHTQMLSKHKMLDGETRKKYKIWGLGEV